MCSLCGKCSTPGHDGKKQYERQMKAFIVEKIDFQMPWWRRSGGRWSSCLQKYEKVKKKTLINKPLPVPSERTGSNPNE